MNGICIDVDDLLGVLKEDGDILKYRRCIELLNNWDLLNEMLSAFEIKQIEDREERINRIMEDDVE